MALKEQDLQKCAADLDSLIDKALKKIQGNKENDLCKYLPGPIGGYMHHFTMRKLKSIDPHQLSSLLKKFIIEAEIPHALDPKPRAPRGSRKQKDFINFTRTDIERVLELARQAGDSDLIARFSPKRSLPALKKELIRSIRENRISEELWIAFSETLGLFSASHQ